MKEVSCYALHENYFRRAKSFVAEFEQREKRASNAAEFQRATSAYLQTVRQQIW